MSETDVTGQTTPEQAGSLIERRLQELRAIALGPSGTPDDGEISPFRPRLRASRDELGAAAAAAEAPTSVRQLVDDLKDAPAIPAAPLAAGAETDHVAAKATPQRRERRLSAVPQAPRSEPTQNVEAANAAAAKRDEVIVERPTAGPGDGVVVEADLSPAEVEDQAATNSYAASVRRRTVGNAGPADSIERVAARIDASLGKIGHLVGEDIARLEQTLHSWGSPSAAAVQLHEQLTASLQRVEHGIRRDLATIVEQVADTSALVPSQDVLLEALAAWSVSFERRVDRRIGETRGALTTLAEQIASGDAALTAELSTVSGAMHEGTEAAMRAIIEETNKASDAERAHLTEIAESLSAARDGAESAVARMVDAAHDLRAGLAETLGEAHEELRTFVQGVVDDSREQVLDAVNSAASELSETLHIHVATQSEETQRTVRQTGRQLVDNVDAVRSRVDEQATRLDEALTDRTTSLGTRVDDRSAEIIEHVKSRSDRVATKVETGTESVTNAVDATSKRISEELHAKHRALTAELAATRVAIENELAVVQETMPGSVAGAIGDRVSTIDDRMAERFDLAIQRIIGEIDYNRLHAVRDLEQLIDTMTSGWAAVIHQMQRTESRLARLELSVEQWFGALADESAEESSATE